VALKFGNFGLEHIFSSSFREKYKIEIIIFDKRPKKNFYFGKKHILIFFSKPQIAKC
jgi:hypothetical protein